MYRTLRDFPNFRQRIGKIRRLTNPSFNQIKSLSRKGFFATDSIAPGPMATGRRNNAGAKPRGLRLFLFPRPRGAPARDSGVCTTPDFNFPGTSRIRSDSWLFRSKVRTMLLCLFPMWKVIQFRIWLVRKCDESFLLGILTYTIWGLNSNWLKIFFDENLENRALSHTE